MLLLPAYLECNIIMFLLIIPLQVPCCWILILENKRYCGRGQTVLIALTFVALRGRKGDKSYIYVYCDNCNVSRKVCEWLRCNHILE